MPHPTKKTTEIMDAIVASVRNGAFATHAAGACGIGRRTLYDWLSQDEEFALRVNEARDAATNESVRILRAHGDKDWRAHAWFLERTRPAEFREQKDLAVTGELTLEQVLFDDPADSVEEIEDADELPALPSPHREIA